MKRLLRFVTVCAVFGLVASAVFFYFITQQPESNFTKSVIVPLVKPIVGFVSGLSPHTNVDETKAEKLLTTDSLQQLFKENEQEATKSYNGKILQVSGTISNIASPTDTNIVVLLAIDSDPMSNISCQMDPAFNARMKGLSEGSIVSIKGICNGVKKDDLLGSTDVLLNRCVIIETEK